MYQFALAVTLKSSDPPTPTTSFSPTPLVNPLSPPLPPPSCILLPTLGPPYLDPTHWGFSCMKSPLTCQRVQDVQGSVASMLPARAGVSVWYSEERPQLSPQLSEVCVDPFSRFSFHLNGYHLVVKAREVSNPPLHHPRPHLGGKRTHTFMSLLLLRHWRALCRLNHASPRKRTSPQMLQILRFLGSDPLRLL